jgi:hypothetical protein
MTIYNRFALTLSLALAAGTCLTAPSLAQKGDAAALSAKINELSRAGKYAEAVPLAQGQLDAIEKKYGPAHRDVGGRRSRLACGGATAIAGHRGRIECGR